MGFAIYDMASGGSPDYGAQAAAAEARRQNAIKLGTNQINAIFSGGSYPYYTQATGTFDPRQSYYTQNAAGKYLPYWAKPSGGGDNVIGQLALGSIPGGMGQLLGETPFDWFGGGDEGPSPRQQAEAVFKRGKLFTKQDINTRGFDQAFYDKRAQDYINFALPQLSRQYQQTRNQIEYNLANRGLLQGSGAAQHQWSDLAQTTAQAKQGIADVGLGQAQQLRRQIEQARSEALSQLYQSADPASATQGATAAAASFSQPSVFAPLANQFSNLINQYYTSQLINAYRPLSYVNSPQSDFGNPGALPQTSTGY